ncbi:hypothetical protein AVEN_191807-1, partial [Araneus ventricosus]
MILGQIENNQWEWSALPLFSASEQHSKLDSVLEKERHIILARSEYLIQAPVQVSGQF